MSTAQHIEALFRDFKMVMPPSLLGLVVDAASGASVNDMATTRGWTRGRFYREERKAHDRLRDELLLLPDDASLAVVSDRLEELLGKRGFRYEHVLPANDLLRLRLPSGALLPQYVRRDLMSLGVHSTDHLPKLLSLPYRPLTPRNNALFVAALLHHKLIARDHPWLGGAATP